MATEGARTAWICRGVAVALAILLLASVARFYHPEYGFTTLIGFGNDPSQEIPALRSIPHQRYPPWSSYDGQFYAQLALDPLLRDPAIDRALDLPAYRARRILFSWTAWALGLGNPARVLQAYALQNVIFWLVLAWVMTAWVGPETPRGLALWAACLFSHGLLWSVRSALLDGPSMCLIAVAIRLSERQHVLASGALAGVAALGRETNLLAVAGLPLPRGRRAWVTTAAALAASAIPLLVWQDYLRSIYRSTSGLGQSQLGPPLVAYAQKWGEAVHDVAAGGLFTAAGAGLAALVALTTQAVYLVVRRRHASAWWRVAAVYACLMLVVDQVVWQGYPGAITRVTLPLVFGFNVLLADEPPRTFWPWFIPGNLHLIAALLVFPPPL